MTTILEWFEVLCLISEKFGPRCALLVLLHSASSRGLPAAQNPRYWFCDYGNLTSFLLVH